MKGNPQTGDVVACESIRYFGFSRKERSDDRKYVCSSQAKDLESEIQLKDQESF